MDSKKERRREKMKKTSGGRKERTEKERIGKREANGR